MKRSILIPVCGCAALILWIAAAVQSPTAAQPFAYQQAPGTAEPTNFALVDVTPQDLPSLSGVGGTPLESNVRIRREPSLSARQIGIVRYGHFIDIVGTNGFDTDRECLNFEDDLDMWVEVAFNHGDSRGWVARCTLAIFGDLSRLPVDATPAPTRTPSPSGTPGR